MTDKRIILLGATGSIGRSTLDVLRNLNGMSGVSHGGYRLVGLSCRSNVEQLLSCAEEFDVTALAATEPASRKEALTWCGADSVLKLIEETEADLVINGIAGSPGLEPSIRALERGMDLALANKETVVMAGPTVFQIAARNSARILPVDSEHSAIFHLLEGRSREKVRRIIITASGGAFRETPLEDFPRLTVADALRHPTWDMGAKITIDSATMANKGLEVIEAHRLFGLSAGQISVVIHPQSTVHSFVETIEGSLYAQVSAPDMRIPIQNAVTYPELADSPFGTLFFDGLSLTFDTPDYERYPMLSLAYETIRDGNSRSLPIVYNAANEIAVDAFSRKEIPFPAIAEVVEKSLSSEWREYPETVKEIMEVHRAAEAEARGIVGSIIGRGRYGNRKEQS